MQRVELFHYRLSGTRQQRLRATCNAHRLTARLACKRVGLFFAGHGDTLPVCQLNAPHFDLLRQRVCLSLRRRDNRLHRHYHVTRAVLAPGRYHLAQQFRVTVQVCGKHKVPVEPGGQQRAFGTRAQQKTLSRQRRQRRGADGLFISVMLRTDPAVELGQLFGKAALFLLIQALLQRAG